MATKAASETPRLTDAQLAEILTLAKDADSIELKVTVPVPIQTQAIRGLPIDPVQALPRQVYFFDTPDLTLNRAGVVVRARRNASGRGDTVIKLRPVVPAELPATLRKDPNFNVEIDILPGGYVCSGSFKGRTTNQEVRDAVNGVLPLRRLFSKAQREFYREHAPEGIDLDSLVPLGPTFLLKTKFEAKSQLDGRKSARLIAAEMWLYPDGSRIFELSTRCRPDEAFQVGMEARAYLAGRGVDLTGVQQTKTKTALEFYADQLKAAAKAEPVAAEAGTAEGAVVGS